jgi:hypothetical protein
MIFGMRLLVKKTLQRGWGGVTLKKKIHGSYICAIFFWFSIYC